MENQKIYITEDEIFPLAKERFDRICGHTGNDPVFIKKLNALALKVYERDFAGRMAKAVVSRFDKEVWKEGTLNIRGHRISSNYFMQMPKDVLEGVYLFALTIGEVCQAASTMEKIYQDIWATAFVDAARELLADQLPERPQSNDKGFLSKDMGPGFYGMDVAETFKFAKILDMKGIGLELNHYGVMIPEKSCTGLYLLLNRDLEIDPGCRFCRGNSAGCRFCKEREGK